MANTRYSAILGLVVLKPEILLIKRIIFYFYINYYHKSLIFLAEPPVAGDCGITTELSFLLFSFSISF
nr:MAG TPA: hypothetical protein [Bacteriophage sp.]